MSERFRGAIEARLLALERMRLATENEQSDMKRQVQGLREGIWSAWTEAGNGITFAPTPTPTPTPTATLYDCCTGFDPGTAISFTDSIFGSGSLLWNPGLGAVGGWAGWLSPLAYAGGGGCAAQTIAIYYEYDAEQQFSVSWLSTNLTSCPAANTAPNMTPGVGQRWNTLVFSPFFNCDATPITASFPMGGSAEELKLRTGFGAQTITMTFTGTAATNSVLSAFCSGVCVHTSLTLVDSLYGNATLTWNGLNWSGTHTGIAYPGTAGCGAATISITYTLDTSGNITLQWRTFSNCPVAGAANTSQAFTGTVNCGASPPTVSASNTSAVTQAVKLRAGGSHTFSVTLTP